MGGPNEWLPERDVTCINRYWGWYVNGGELDRGLANFEREIDDLWEAFRKPIILTVFGADTVAGLHGQPPMMWSEEYQAEYVRGRLEVAGRKDFVAVQSAMRVGGMNMKGVFTRTRQPKMATHVLREFWVEEADVTHEPR